MVWNVYVRDGKVYVPTMAQTQAGYYLEIGPVDVVQISDTALLCNALARVVRMGNPVVPTPTRAAFPKWVVLEAAGVKSRKAFERTAQLWRIRKTPSSFRFSQASKWDEDGWDGDGDAISQECPGQSEVGDLALSFAAAIKR
jgi:hypothetical protein